MMGHHSAADDGITRIWIERTNLRENQKDGGDRPAIWVQRGAADPELHHEVTLDTDPPVRLVTRGTTRPFEGEGPHIWVETSAGTADTGRGREDG